MAARMRSGLCLAICWIAAAQEPELTFKTRVHLVSVPVVVRDKAGRAVGNLEKQDFQLFDKGKPQVISRFSVERSGGRRDAPAAREDEVQPESVRAPVLPERFVAYLFDDVHLEFGDIVRLRDAARRHLKGLADSDRAAIYTTSGQNMLDFTDDRDAWNGALARLSPRPLAAAGAHECPNLSFYMANQIIHRSDTFAMQSAVAETIACANLDRDQRSFAESIARSTAQRIVSENDRATRVALSVLRDVVRRLGVAPGQRTIVLASPGFITSGNRFEETEIIDRAIRSGVMINAIDGRGLWVDPTFDASRPGSSADVMRVKSQYDRTGASLQADVLAEFASGTGGTFFQNSNDLDDGFKRVAAPPEYSYVLGFSPQNLQMDGSFHNLKVGLQSRKGLTTFARKGYYAPKQLTDPAETAKVEIRDALFSREELNELPVDLKSEFVKKDDKTAVVTVVAHTDMKSLRSRNLDGRRQSNLTISIAIFDRNGKYVTGVHKVAEMKWKDGETPPAQNGGTGLTVRSTFDVAPGSYLVRLVIRDSVGEQMSARNGMVDVRWP